MITPLHADHQFQNRRQDLARRSKKLQSSTEAGPSSSSPSSASDHASGSQTYHGEPPAPPPGRTNLGSWDPDSGKWRTVPTACIGALAGPRPDREAILRAIVTGEIDRDDYIDNNPDYLDGHPALQDDKIKNTGEDAWQHVPVLTAAGNASSSGGVLSSIQLRAQAAVMYPGREAESRTAPRNDFDVVRMNMNRQGNSGPTGVPLGRWVSGTSRMEEVMAARDVEAPTRQYRRSEQPVPETTEEWRGDNEALINMMPSDPPSMGVQEMLGSDGPEGARLAPMEEEEDEEDEEGEEGHAKPGYAPAETPVRKGGRGPARVLELSNPNSRQIRGLTFTGAADRAIDRPTLGRATSFDLLRSSKRAKQLAGASASRNGFVYADENSDSAYMSGRHRPLKRSASAMNRSLSSIGESNENASMVGSSKAQQQEQPNKRHRSTERRLADLDMKLNHMQPPIDLTAAPKHDLNINIDIPRGGRFDIKTKHRSSFPRGSEINGEQNNDVIDLESPTKERPMGQGGKYFDDGANDSYPYFRSQQHYSYPNSDRTPVPSYQMPSAIPGSGSTGTSGTTHAHLHTPSGSSADDVFDAAASRPARNSPSAQRRFHWSGESGTHRSYLGCKQKRAREASGRDVGREAEIDNKMMIIDGPERDAAENLLSIFRKAGHGHEARRV